MKYYAFKLKFKSIVLLSSLFLLSACSFSFENSTGGIGQTLEEYKLVRISFMSLDLENNRVIEDGSLKGVVRVRNDSDKPVSGPLLFEFATTGNFLPVWSAVIDVSTIEPGQMEEIPFLFYHEDINSNLNMGEVRNAMEMEGVGVGNQFPLDLLVRSQGTDIRSGFVFFLPRKT